MKVQAYISYRGRCGEALEFYKNAIGAEITELMRWKDSPDAAMALGQGGRVTMASMKTFWTSSFGMLTDKFGVPWTVNAAAPKA